MSSIDMGMEYDAVAKKNVQKFVIEPGAPRYVRWLRVITNGTAVLMAIVAAASICEGCTFLEESAMLAAVSAGFILSAFASYRLYRWRRPTRRRNHWLRRNGYTLGMILLGASFIPILFSVKYFGPWVSDTLFPLLSSCRGQLFG